MACVPGSFVRGIHRDQIHTGRAVKAVGAVSGSNTGNGNLLGDSERNALSGLDLLDKKTGYSLEAYQVLPEPSTVIFTNNCKIHQRVDKGSYFTPTMCALLACILWSIRGCNRYNLVIHFKVLFLCVTG